MPRRQACAPRWRRGSGRRSLRPLTTEGWPSALPQPGASAGSTHAASCASEPLTATSLFSWSLAASTGNPRRSSAGPCTATTSRSKAWTTIEILAGRPIDLAAPPRSPSPPATRYPEGISFPVATFCPFDGTLADLPAGTSASSSSTTLSRSRTSRCGTATPSPLQTNLTTPLAYMLSGTVVRRLLRVFFASEKVHSQQGMLHARALSAGQDPGPDNPRPAVLADRLGTALQRPADRSPIEQKRTICWFYFYPTTNPYLETAADLHCTTCGTAPGGGSPGIRMPRFDQIGPGRPEPVGSLHTRIC